MRASRRMFERTAAHPSRRRAIARLLGMRPFLERVNLERVNRQCAEHHSRNESEGAIESGDVQAAPRSPRKGTRMQVQAGFRR